MKLQTNNKQQPALLRENGPLIIIILSVLILGAVAIGVWHYLELNNSQQNLNQFENEVNGLVESVSEEPQSSQENEKKKVEKKETNQTLAAKTNPFQSPLKKVEKTTSDVAKNNSSGSNNSKDNQPEKKVKERIGDQVRVLGLLGGPGKRLAIIGIGNNVQIVKPGDRISSLVIKDIDKKRVLAEEYGTELTYTFGGGQD